MRYVKDDYDGGQPTAYGITKEIAGILSADGFEVGVHSNAAQLEASMHGRDFLIQVKGQRHRSR